MAHARLIATHRIDCTHRRISEFSLQERTPVSRSVLIQHYLMQRQKLEASKNGELAESWAKMLLSCSPIPLHFWGVSKGVLTLCSFPTVQATHTLAARDANAVLGHSFPPQMLSQGQLSYWVGMVLLRNAAFTLGFHRAFAPVSIRQYVFQRHICVLGLNHDAIFRHLTFAWRFHEKSGNEH